MLRQQLKNPSQSLITGRNEVVAKVMFLHVCVILFTGGVSRQGEPSQEQTPPDQTPPRSDIPRSTHPPPKQTPTTRIGRTPPQGRENPLPQEQTPQEQTPPPGPDPPPSSTLQHTVNERPVYILLECILVFFVLRQRLPHISVLYYEIEDGSIFRFQCTMTKLDQ